MGKGDRKSGRGKLWRKSHGKTRPKHKKSASDQEEKQPAKKK